jgi:inner membrane protein
MGTVPIPSAPAQKWGLSPFSLAALSVVAAYATHILLDFLGNDTSAPYGVMALWPFSREYFLSPVPVFPAITRRYWLAGFWEQNLRALLFELAVLGPIVMGAWWWRRQPRDLP